MASEDFAAHLASLLANDKTAGYQPALFQKIVLAFIDTNGSEWARIKDVLLERHVYSDYLKRIKKRAHELEGIVEIGGETRGEVTVKDAWPDATVSSTCVPPPGWGYGDPRAAVFRLETKTVDGQRVTRRVTVSYEPVLITRRMQHKDTGVVYVELSWKTSSKWHAHVFERDAVFSSRRIVECGRYGAPVGSDNAAELVQYLRAYENENIRSIPVGYAQSTMGWLGDEDDLGHHGFLVGDRQIGANGQQVEYVGDAGADFKVGGTMEGWKAAIARLAPWPAMRVAICACLAPPLVGIVGAPNTIVEFVGETSGGKSVALRTGSTCWRSARAKLPRWNATANGLEARAQVLNDLPLVVDDTADVPESKRRDLLGQAVYMLESGHTRTRSTKTLHQAPARQWRTLVLSSGEYSLCDYIGTGGAAARVLSFWGSPLGAASEKTGTEVADVMLELGHHYGHAGPMLVQWLCDNRDRWESIAYEYRKIVSGLRKLLNSRVAMRLAETIALLEVTAKIANEALGLGWDDYSLMADPYVGAAIERALEEAQFASNKAREAWEHCVSFAESRRSQWAVWGDTPSAREEPNGGWLGWKRIGDPGEATVLRDIEKDDGADLLAWLPSQLKRVLQDAGYLPEVVLKAWRDQGVLLISRGRLTYVAKCAGGEKAHRIYLMKANKTPWDAGM